MTLCAYRVQAESNFVSLKTKQGDVFKVDRDVVCRSVTIKNMMEDTVLDMDVPLPMVDSSTLMKVRAYAMELFGFRGNH